QEHVFKPLGMTNSGIGLKARESNENLPVFNSKGKPVPHWDFHDSMAGAGAVCSTISDMLTYIDANLSLTDHALHSALAESQKEHQD
ncbi:serine hydrolase, partial [Acinetobacter baumannii]|uniref:serine hydrolase n=1 Tax=Acinetobacter baumannii TaxID=470 RepID=UPI0033282693